MHGDVVEFFDAAYLRHDRYWWRVAHRYSTSPTDHINSLITMHLLEELRGQPPGAALDIGAGEGSDAIRLAMLGYEVEAVELSSIGAAKVQRFAREAGVGDLINVLNIDARKFRADRQYDVVICNGVLHYIADKRHLITLLQDSTVAGGYHAIALWSNMSPVPNCHRTVDVYPDAEDGVVMKMYEGWKVHGPWFEHNKVDLSHPSPDLHRHSHIKFIARKPG